MEDVEPAEAQLAIFRRLLANTLVTGVTSSFLWFALTFWVYLETRSVVATGVIGGAFSISSAILGPFFGTYVDRHRKHTAMVLADADLDAPASPSPPSCSSPSTPTTCCSCAARGSGCSSGFTLLGSVAGHDAGHRPVDLRDPARPRGPARPGQRHGRHGHRRLVRHHVGLQRPGHRQRWAWAGRYYGVAGAHGRRPRSTCGRSTSTSPSRSRSPRARPPATSTSGAPSRPSAPCPG